MKEKSEKKVEEKEPQLNKNEAKLHYDSSDLVQFHELNLDKPLVKAVRDLDYEHPTIIQ